MTTVVGEVQVTYVRWHSLIGFDCGSLSSCCLATKLTLEVLHFFFSGIFPLLSFERDLVGGRGAKRSIPEFCRRMCCAARAC